MFQIRRANPATTISAKIRRCTRPQASRQRGARRGRW
jgi:hypothetical protein